MCIVFLSFFNDGNKYDMIYDDMTTSATPWVTGTTLNSPKVFFFFFWNYVKNLRRENMGVAELENNGS